MLDFNGNKKLWGRHSLPQIIQYTRVEAYSTPRPLTNAELVYDFSFDNF